MKSRTMTRRRRRRSEKKVQEEEEDDPPKRSYNYFKDSLNHICSGSQRIIQNPKAMQRLCASLVPIVETIMRHQAGLQAHSC
jgi:hypothetical protein